MIQHLDVLAVLYAVEHKPMALIGEDDLLSARIQLLTDLRALIESGRGAEAVKERRMVMRNPEQLAAWMAEPHDQPLEAALRILVTAAVGVLETANGMVLKMLATWECALDGDNSHAAELCRRHLGRDLAAVIHTLESFGLIQKTAKIRAMPAPAVVM